MGLSLRVMVRVEARIGFAVSIMVQLRATYRGYHLGKVPIQVTRVLELIIGHFFVIYFLCIA